MATVSADTGTLSLERIRRDGPVPDFTGEALVLGRQARVRLSEFSRLWTVLLPVTLPLFDL